MSHTPSSTDAVEVFMKSWRLYQDIIEHNYMFHREISAAARAAIDSFEPGKPLRVIDLGCGDASMALPFLNPDRVILYKGCDLSQPALDIARTQLTDLGIAHRLVCDDMRTFVTEQPTASADVVIASYALHHLNATDKQQLVREVIRTLVPGGRFLLIDIFREPDEDRVNYMKHYTNQVRNTWVGLSQESQALVINHATEFDFPEHPDFYQTHWQKAGFIPGQLIVKHTWHQAWAFTR